MQERAPHIAANTLAREKRIQKRRDFLRVQRYGMRSFGRFVVAIAQHGSDVSHGRLGITVPKKVGPAHVRNKIKRRIRHVFRNNQNILEKKFLVVVAKEPSAYALFSELSADILQACSKFKAANSFPHRTRHPATQTTKRACS